MEDKEKKKMPMFGGMDALSDDSEEIQRQNRLLKMKRELKREFFGRASADREAGIAEMAEKHGGLRARKKEPNASY